MSWSSRVVSALAAVLVGTVAGAVPGPAQAAGGYCPKGSGATVVVDRGALGGGTSVGCDPNGANTAGSTVVPRAGFSLTYVQQQPGFVCRVGGAPASASCATTPPSNAYWGLFWSDGKSGRWTYASTGVGSLKVPAGGFIGWKWQNSSARTAPGRAPISPAAASPQPGPKPKPKPAPKPAPKAGPRHAPGTHSVPSSSGSSAHSTATSPGHASAGATKHTAGSGSATAAPHSARQQAARQHKAAHAKKAAAVKRSRASASASASESAAVPGQGGASSASPSPELTSGDAAPSGGSGPMLPLLAAGILVVLLGAAGRLVWVRRRG